MKNLFIIYNMALFFLFASFFSCNKKGKDDLNMIITNYNIKNKDIIKIKILNNSNKDYFIVMDTINYNDLNQNYSINEILRPKQIFFINNDSIKIKVFSNIYKQLKLDTTYINCNKIKRNESINFINRLKKLENITVIKHKSSTTFSIPFSTNYSICNKEFKYEMLKNKIYNIQLNYQMKKRIFESLVSKEKIKELEEKKIFPYYGNLFSNKVKIKLAN
jgi:hypothetical protein